MIKSAINTLGISIFLVPIEKKYQSSKLSGNVVLPHFSFSTTILVIAGFLTFCLHIREENILYNNTRR